MKQTTKLRQGSDYYISGILKGDRIILAQAITLAESTLQSDQMLAADILNGVVSSSGNSIRIGISGPPGVGKSTFIETFGQFIISQGHKLAVLAIDPSSQRTKGSILGDKTRMSELASNPKAFIRPSASADALGGVAHRTREAILLCEAAGFDVILVETVGVGQSEVAVKNMTDVFLLLMLAGAGDELQGIKKGIMEMADMIVITKADGDNIKRAMEASTEFQHAIHLLFNHHAQWLPKVITASAIENRGLDETWGLVTEFVAHMKTTGMFTQKRNLQNINHMHEHFSQLMKSLIDSSTEMQRILQDLETGVGERTLSPSQAANTLFQKLREHLQSRSS